MAKLRPLRDPGSVRPPDTLARLRAGAKLRQRIVVVSPLGSFIRHLDLFIVSRSKK
jgi:hypothetical protein